MRQRGVMWCCRHYLLKCLGSFTVVYLIWRGRNLSIWLFNSMHGLLHIQEIKTKLAEPKAISSFFFCGKQLIFHLCPFHVGFRLSVSVAIWNTASVPFPCMCAFVSVRVCVYWVCRQASGPASAFCNHTMTAPDEVTVNSEPVLIITFVCFWICYTLSQNLLLFFSHYSYDMSQYGREVAACQCGLKSRASEHKVTSLKV